MPLADCEALTLGNVRSVAAVHGFAHECVFVCDLHFAPVKVYIRTYVMSGYHEGEIERETMRFEEFLSKEGGDY